MQRHLASFPLFLGLKGEVEPGGFHECSTTFLRCKAKHMQREICHGTCKDLGNDGSLLVGRNGAVLW